MTPFTETAREYWAKAWRLVRASEGRVSDWTICQAGVPWRFANAALCFYEIRTRKTIRAVSNPMLHYEARGVYYNL